MRMSGFFRRIYVAAIVIGLSFFLAPGAQAFVPIGEPNNSQVIYHCKLTDYRLLSTTLHPVEAERNGLWITRNSRQDYPEWQDGAFSWHYPYSDIVLGGFYRKVLDFDVYGRATRQLVVGPDGKARYSAAYLDDEGNSRFETYDMTCEKGEAY